MPEIPVRRRQDGATVTDPEGRPRRRPEIQVRRRPAEQARSARPPEIEVRRRPAEPPRPSPTHRPRRDLAWLIWPLLGLGLLSLAGLALLNMGRSDETVAIPPPANTAGPAPAPIGATAVTQLPAAAAPTTVTPPTAVAAVPTSSAPAPASAVNQGAQAAAGTPQAAPIAPQAAPTVPANQAPPGAAPSGPAPTQPPPSTQVPTEAARGGATITPTPAAPGDTDQASSLTVEQVVTGLPLGQPERLAALAGRRVRLTNVRVQELHADRTFWIGPSRERRVPVYIQQEQRAGGGNEGSVEVRPGQIANLNGSLRRPPGAEELRAVWGLAPDEAAALQAEEVYIHIDDVRDFRVVGP